MLYTHFTLKTVSIFKNKFLYSIINYFLAYINNLKIHCIRYIQAAFNDSWDTYFL